MQIETGPVTLDEGLIQSHIDQFGKLFEQLDERVKEALYEYIGSCPGSVEWALAMEYVVSAWAIVGSMGDAPQGVKPKH